MFHLLLDHMLANTQNNMKRIMRVHLKLNTLRPILVYTKDFSIQLILVHTQEHLLDTLINNTKVCLIKHMVMYMKKYGWEYMMHNIQVNIIKYT